jgi:flavin reductase (DIM6/NTAB) family NADH-FMN oxidoreductase RutF
MFLDLPQLTISERQHWLQYAIAPRPIALASTVDGRGAVNLSPFSFFNLFSAEPPVVIFSPSRRVRNNTLKHTLHNVWEVPQVVINICDESMVQQVSLSSHDYPEGVNEFEKAGFTMEKSSGVLPPMVKEAKIKLECQVLEVKELGKQGGAGYLVICEVLCMHVEEEILNADRSMIDQQKMHHLARLGGDWYCVTNKNNLFKVAKPGLQTGIGIDALPAGIRNNAAFTANQLGQLAGVPVLPLIDPDFELDDSLAGLPFQYIQTLLEQQKVQEAWQVLLHGRIF